MSLISYSVEILILAVIIGKYFWSRKSRYNFAANIPGPKTLPILGNGLLFWCKDEDIFERAVKCISEYPSPMRFWLGPKLCIFFNDPRQVEKILSSMTFAYKDDVYKFLQYFTGEGLIAGSGPKWKRDRRLMSPLFLKRRVTNYFPVILHHTKILVKILEEKVDQPTFNIEHYIHRATTDFVNETIVGKKTNAQSGELDELLENINRAYELIHRRIVKPWLQVDFLFRFTHSYREQVEAKKVMHGFFWKVLEDAKENHAHLGRDSDTARTVLDHLLDIRNEVPDFATDEELVHHLATLYSASEDTVTIICAFVLVLLGMYPEYQKKVALEIFTVIGKNRDVVEEDMPKLEFLEMVIKETLRLFPIAPFIMRQTSQDTELEGIRIPKATSVAVSIHNIHRNANHWERPNEFYPEHFLPEAVRKRHPHAYLPFSAGIRSCVGKVYAFMAMKIVLVTILQTYIVEADGTLQDKALRSDISVRFKDDQYPIRIKKRL